MENRTLDNDEATCVKQRNKISNPWVGWFFP